MLSAMSCQRQLELQFLLSQGATDLKGIETEGQNGGEWTSLTAHIF
jgi:hypothetical protein